MKTNKIARRVVRIRRTAICLALVGMTALAYGFGGSIGKHCPAVAGSQHQAVSPAACNLDVLMAAGR